MKDYHGGNGVRFAELEELQKTAVHVDLCDESLSGGGIPVFSNGREMDVIDEDTRTLIIADSGAGKSRRIIRPMMYSIAKAKYSMVVHDAKGELVKANYRLLQEMGYTIKVINFRETQRGNRYNPLYYPAKLYQEGKKSKAIDMFFNFAVSLYEPVQSEKDPFWTNTSINYFTGLCILACELMPLKDISLDNIYQLHVEGNRRFGGSTIMKTFFELKKSYDTSLWRLMEATIDAPIDTRASILSVMTQVLSRLVINDEVMDLLSGPMDWEYEDLGKKPVAVFLVTKDEDTMYNSIISSIVQQIYVGLVDYADTKCNGILPQRVEFVMDEFGNMAKLQDINEKITASRSRNIRWHLVIQSLEQLSLKYGKESKIIMENCNVWMYMYSADKDVLTMISDRCGEYISEYTYENRRLLETSTLQHFNKERGETLVLYGRHYPYVTYLPDISHYEMPVYELSMEELEVREKQKRQLFHFDKIVNELQKRKLEDLMREGRI